MIDWSAVFCVIMRAGPHYRRIHAGCAHFQAFVCLGVDFAHYYLMENDTGFTPDYAVTGWRKAFKIVDGNHSRLNVLEARMCANFGDLGLVYCKWGCGHSGLARSIFVKLWRHLRTLLQIGLWCQPIVVPPSANAKADRTGIKED
jgi:hypothetical protein